MRHCTQSQALVAYHLVLKIEIKSNQNLAGQFLSSDSGTWENQKASKGSSPPSGYIEPRQRRQRTWPCWNQAPREGSTWVEPSWFRLQDRNSVSLDASRGDQNEGDLFCYPNTRRLILNPEFQLQSVNKYLNASYVQDTVLEVKDTAMKKRDKSPCLGGIRWAINTISELSV